MKRSRHAGFSLLEVMVAVGILGLSLTVILSAQTGLVASTKSAANMSGAIMVGRCKMSELEEKQLKFGYQEIDEIDSSKNCCEDKEVPGFTCEWRVEKVVLPIPQSNLDGGSMPIDQVLNGALDGGVPPSIIPGAPGAAPLDLDAGLANLGTNLQSQFASMGGAQGLLTMVFSIVYPSLKPLLELSIRRITVTVKWKEGVKDRELALTQFVTNPARAGLLNGFDGGLGIEGGAAPIGSTPVGGGIGPSTGPLQPPGAGPAKF